MKKNWSALSPLGKTVVICGTVELVIFSSLFLVTDSALAALCSVLCFGPVSIWLAPALLRQFRTTENRLAH